MSGGVAGLLERFLPVPPVGLGPSLNLLPPKSSPKVVAWQPTLNLTTAQPTVDLATSGPAASFIFSPGAAHGPGPQASEYFLAPAPSKNRRIAQPSYFQAQAPSRAARRTRRASTSVARWVAVAALWTVLGLGAGILLSLSLPLLFGYRTFVVMSGSMEPAIHTGDVVIDQRIAPAQAKVGDIVTYRDPANPTRLITHRVRWVGVSGDHVNFVTKGDANNNSQRWSIATTGTVGVVRFRIVKLGYVLVRINTPLGRICLIIVPLLLLSGYEIAWIWRREAKGKGDRGAAWA